MPPKPKPNPNPNPNPKSVAGVSKGKPSTRTDTLPVNMPNIAGLDDDTATSLMSKYLLEQGAQRPEWQNIKLSDRSEAGPATESDQGWNDHDDDDMVESEDDLNPDDPYNYVLGFSPNNPQYSAEFNAAIEEFQHNMGIAVTNAKQREDAMKKAIDDMGTKSDKLSEIVGMLVPDFGRIPRDLVDQELQRMKVIADELDRKRTGLKDQLILSKTNPSPSELLGKKLTPEEIKLLRNAHVTYQRFMQNKILSMPNEPGKITRLRDVVFDEESGLIATFNKMLGDKTPNDPLKELFGNPHLLSIPLLAIASIGPWFAVQCGYLNNPSIVLGNDLSNRLCEMIVKVIVFKVLPISHSLIAILNGHLNPNTIKKLAGGLFGTVVAWSNFPVFRQAFYGSSVCFKLMVSLVTSTMLESPWSSVCIGFLVYQNGSWIVSSLSTYMGVENRDIAELFDHRLAGVAPVPEINFRDGMGTALKTLALRLIHGSVATGQSVLTTIGIGASIPQAIPRLFERIKQRAASYLQLCAVHNPGHTYSMSLLGMLRSEIMDMLTDHTLSEDVRKELNDIKIFLGCVSGEVTDELVEAFLAQKIIVNGDFGCRAKEDDIQAVTSEMTYESQIIAAQVIDSAPAIDAAQVEVLPNGDVVLYDRPGEPAGSNVDVTDRRSMGVFAEHAGMVAPGNVKEWDRRKKNYDESGKFGGGRSRSRKRSVSKRTRRKGVAKKQKSKKNKRQSRRKVRRASSRKSRK